MVVLFFFFFFNQSCGWWLLRWVCGGGGGGLLIGLCLWSMFVVVVGCPKPLLWAVVVGCGGGVDFFFAGFVGLLNFGCFYV